MKTTLLYIISLLFVSAIYGQDFYAGAQFVTSSDGTRYIVQYKYNTKLLIERATNNHTNQGMLYKDGSQVVAEPYINATANDNNNILLNKSFRDALSASTINSLKNSRATFGILLIVNPNGSIKELRFSLPDTATTRSLSPDTYKNIEDNLKRNLTFKMDEYTKETYQLIHIYCMFQTSDL